MRPFLPTLLFLPLCGLVAIGCGSSSGGGGGASTAAPVQSGSSANTTTASSAPTTTAVTPTTTGTQTPPATTPAGNNAPIPTTSEDRYYNPHVRSTLLTYCTSCHANSSNPAALNAYPLSGFPTDQISFNETKSRTNDMDPERSLLLQKAINAVPHGGGKVLDRSDVGYAWLVNWIRQGGRYDEFENAPRTFARDIQPILDRGCFGCHSGGAGGFRVSTDLMANFNEMVRLTDANAPLNSRVLRKNDGGINHAGGAPWAQGRPERDVVLQWIQDGRRYAR